MYLVIFIVLVLCFFWKYPHWRYTQLRMSRILPHLSKSDKILDVGCADCCLTKRLQTMGYEITGLDVVNEGKFFQPTIYDGGRFPFPDNSFDVIICAFVLHHIPNYLETLEEIQRVTRKSVLIFEDTPKNQFDWKLANLHESSKWGRGNFHQEKEWVDIFKANFSSVNAQPISRFEFPFSKQPFFYPMPANLFILTP